MIETINGISGEHIKNIFGEYDAHAKLIERTLHVTLIQRENELKIVGEEGPVKLASDCINSLLDLSKRGNVISEQNVNYSLSLTKEHNSGMLLKLDDERKDALAKVEELRARRNEISYSFVQERKNI